MSLPYAIFMAARVTGKPLEFFQQLPAREAVKLKNLVVGFSLRRGWGGIPPPEIRKACVALSLQLHSGIDYFLEMSLEDLNDLAKVVMEYAQEQSHGTGHQNRR